MGKYDKLLLQVLRGLSDSNIGFDELCGLLKQLGFEMRVRGSHHVFTLDGVREADQFAKRWRAGKAIPG